MSIIMRLIGSPFFWIGLYMAINIGSWMTEPDETSIYVLVKKGQDYYYTGAPVPTSVFEVLDERGIRENSDYQSKNALRCSDFVEINEIAHKVTCAPTNSMLKELRDSLDDPEEIRVPALFSGTLGSGSSITRCYAWLPGLINMLVVGDRNIIAWPFGPNDGTGKDLYWEYIKSALPGTLKAINGWHYHERKGEVHCGTNTKRTPPSTMLKWWDTWKDM